MTNSNELEDSLRSDYIKEARILLSDVEGSIRLLGKDRSNRSLLDRIFRTVHTVKISGSMVGLDGLTRFAHQFQSFLSEVQESSLPIDDAVLELLSESNTLLIQWMNGLETDPGLNRDTAGILGKIKVYLTPAAAGGTTESQSVAAQPMTAANDQATILLVDDEADILDLYDFFLEGLDVKTLRASDGLEAINILKKQVPDLMIFDLRMPNMNGMELLGYVRKKFPEIPVIFVSGYSDRADIINMLNQGAFAFLGKPVTREVFLNEVRNGLREHAMRMWVQKLSHLNFTAFLCLARISHSRDAGQRHESEQKMKEILDEIVDIQNNILEVKYPLLMAR